MFRRRVLDQVALFPKTVSREPILGTTHNCAMLIWHLASSFVVTALTKNSNLQVPTVMASITGDGGPPEMAIDSLTGGAVPDAPRTCLGIVEEGES